MIVPFLASDLNLTLVMARISSRVQEVLGEQLPLFVKIIARSLDAMRDNKIVRDGG